MNLAALLALKCKFEEAEAWIVPAWQMSREKLGTKHEQTQHAQDILGTIYMNQQKMEQAEALVQELYDIAKEESGLDHEDTIRRANNLAHLFQSRQKYDEAEHLCRITLEACLGKLGAKSNGALVLRSLLGSLMLLGCTLDKHSYSQIPRSCDHLGFLVR